MNLGYSILLTLIALSSVYPMYADETRLNLGRGLNMGNYLEAAGQEGAWTGGLLIQENDFKRIREKGFDTVRIPVRWSDHCLKTAPYTIDPAFISRVSQVVQWALSYNLKVVLNVHHYEEMMTQGREKLPYHRDRLSAIWAQICDAFPLQAYPREQLVFELLNEPNGTVGFSEWNEIIKDLTDLIWKTKKQIERFVMIGTANWGGVAGLEKLVLPESCNNNNTIITIHFYEPFQFTHQGAEWVQGSSRWIGTRWKGTPKEQQSLITLLDTVQAWNRHPRRSFHIFIGEFGSYGKHALPKDRGAWTAFVVRELENRSMSWAYWEYSQGFGAYDPVSGLWRQEIIGALLGDGTL